MGKFDDLLLKAKDLASAAGTKAQEVAELTKIHLQASQLKNEIDANYLKLGEIIYELKKNDTENEELISMCIAEIESQLCDLEEINAKINEMKNVVKCPECMADNPIGALYCARCGASLKEQKTAYEASAAQAYQPVELPATLVQDEPDEN